MHVWDPQGRVQMHLRNLPPNIARSLALATPADENALFLQLKSLDSFHRSTLVSTDTVALVNAPVVDAVPVSPVEGPDSVNRLASALVNAMELGQGSNSRRGQSQQSRFDNKGYYKYPDNNRGRGGNRRGRQKDRYPQGDQEERGRATNFRRLIQGARETDSVEVPGIAQESCVIRGGHRRKPSVCPVWGSITLHRSVPTKSSQPGRKSWKDFPYDPEFTEFKKQPTAGELVSSAPAPCVKDYVCLANCGPNLLYLEVRIGSQPSSALLDTGASMSCIDPSIKIEKKPIFPREGKGISGNTLVNELGIIPLWIGKRSFTHPAYILATRFSLI
jgi:hypothetical protein